MESEKIETHSPSLNQETTPPDLFVESRCELFFFGGLGNFCRDFVFEKIPEKYWGTQCSGPWKGDAVGFLTKNCSRVQKNAKSSPLRWDMTKIERKGFFLAMLVKNGPRNKAEFAIL